MENPVATDCEPAVEGGSPERRLEAARRGLPKKERKDGPIERRLRTGAKEPGKKGRKMEKR